MKKPLKILYADIFIEKIQFANNLTLLPGKLIYNLAIQVHHLKEIPAARTTKILRNESAAHNFGGWNCRDGTSLINFITMTVKPVLYLVPLTFSEKNAYLLV